MEHNSDNRLLSGGRVLRKGGILLHGRGSRISIAFTMTSWSDLAWLEKTEPRVGSIIAWVRLCPSQYPEDSFLGKEPSCCLLTLGQWIQEQEKKVRGRIFLSGVLRE